MDKSRRSTGEPYLSSLPLQKRLVELRPVNSKKSSKASSDCSIDVKSNDDNANKEVPSTSPKDDSILDDELSRDIALAVATIVAESEMLGFGDEEEDDNNGPGKKLSRQASSSGSRVASNSVKRKNSISSVSSRTSTAAKQGKKAGVKHESEEPSPNGLTTPVPSRAAKMGGSAELVRYLGRVQNYMNQLGYHREGEPTIRINPRLSMKMQMITAKEIIRYGLPIKCLHAVVLAVHFTNSTETVERFPIYFRSHVNGREYKHIVLGIYAHGHFGALGISRDPGLQDKKTTYSKLSDLVFDFANCYSESGHVLNEVKFGNIITHDQNSLEKIFSKIGTISIHGSAQGDIEANVEKFAKQLRAKMGLACLKSLRLESQPPPSGLPRTTHSKTSLNDNNTATFRARTLSLGPGSNRSSQDSIIGRRTKSKPPKSKRK